MFSFRKPGVRIGRRAVFGNWDEVAQRRVTSRLLGQLEGEMRWDGGQVAPGTACSRWLGGLWRGWPGCRRGRGSASCPRQTQCTEEASDHYSSELKIIPTRHRWKPMPLEIVTNFLAMKYGLVFFFIYAWTNLLMNTRGSAASKEIFVCVEIVPGVNTVCLSGIVNETKDI